MFGRSSFEQKWLLLECDHCGHLGAVEATEEEWHYAVDAHVERYPFDDLGRVKYLGIV